MGGDMDGWFFPSLDGGSRTVVLMGRTGNGKSATGNSILGKKSFESKASMSSVTSHTELITTKIANGQVVNVIDTPGFSDSSLGLEVISKEIVKCIGLAKDGIHAILLVLSVKNRFTEEESDAIRNLKNIFCPKITDYIIVVYTNGDSLDKNQSLEDFLSGGCPDSLKKLFHDCKNRMVLFDNNTEDEMKKAMQLQKLLGLVDQVIEENDGKPYTNFLFSEMKEVAKRHLQEKEQLKEQELTVQMEKLQKSCYEQFKRMVDMVEAKMTETNLKLQQQLAEEKAARLIAEKKSDEDIKELRKRLAKAEKEANDAKAEKEANDAKAEKEARDAKAEKDYINELRERLAKAEKEIKDAKADKAKAENANSRCAIL